MVSAFPDGLNFIKRLNLKRVQNAWSTYYSFKKAQRNKNPHHEGLPFSLAVEPTTSCNLRCPECPSGLRSFTRPTGMMQNETFQKVIDELEDYLLYLTMYFQGEPFLHPNFLELVSYADLKNIYTATSSNGHFLDEEVAIKTVESGLSRIIISIDGTDQESYEKYRIGGKLEMAITGIKNIVKAKKELRKNNPYLILQFLLFRHNTNQIEEAKTLARKLGVDKIEFKTAQIYNFDRGSDLIPQNGKYSRYQKKSDATFKIKNDHLNKCWKMWHSCVMTWDGDIVPCCFDKDAKYKMGNINQQSFREIWNGEKYQEFRLHLFENRKEIDICKNCTEGLRV